MSYLYSLYDALVSIAVPADKARAVVDAMEHDMATTLATKPDLENLRLATKSDLNTLRLETKADLDNLRLTTQQALNDLRRDMEAGFKSVEVRFQSVDEKFDNLRRELSKDIATVRQSIIIQLASVILACFVATLAVMRFWLA